MDPARVKGVPNCPLMSNKNILTDWDEATDRDHHNKAQGLRARYEHTQKDQLAFPRYYNVQCRYTLLPEYLQTMGYSTHMIGKYVHFCAEKVL